MGFVCRSASFDTLSLTCFLTQETKSVSNRKLWKQNEDFDYLENDCLVGNYTHFVFLGVHPNWVKFAMTTVKNDIFELS